MIKVKTLRCSIPPLSTSEDFTMSPTTPTPSSPVNAPAKGIPHVQMYVVLVIGLVLAGLAGMLGYHFLAVQPLKERLTAERSLSMRLSGLQSPAQNKLDARYADSDGNLLADPPSDPAQQIDPPTLSFCYLNSPDDAAYRQSMSDLMAVIARATDKQIEYLNFETPQDQMIALRDGKLHISAFSTGGVPQAVCIAGFIPVAGLGNEQGISRYEMEILVAAGSPVKAVAELRGRELTFTTRSSNSGCKAPMVLLHDNFELMPGRDYGVRYSGGHDKSIAGLVAGKFETIAVANDVLERAITKGTIKKEQFRSIYKSESFPTVAIGYASSLKPEVAQKIRQAILTFDWKGTSVEAGLGSSGHQKFVPIDYKADWRQVRRIDEAVGSHYQIKE